MRRIVCGLLLWSLVVSPALGQADAPEGRQLRLKNGLTILLQPIAGAEQVALVVSYAVGEQHDPPGASGLAHLVEHAYVTSAAGRQPARSVEQFIEHYPAGWNAQTGADYSLFATVFSPDRLAAELEDAAARMSELHIAADDLAREMPRIHDELFTMYVGNPALAADNLARAMVRPAAAGARRGGVVAHMARLSASDVQQHWHRYYKPRHAVVVLAGAIDAADARQRAARAFGPLPAGEPLPPVARATAPQQGLVTRAEARPTDPDALSEVALAFAAPHPGEPLYPAFLVLAARLQIEAAALQQSADAYPFRFAALDRPDSVCLGLAVARNQAVDEPLDQLEQFVQRVVNQPFTADDRLRARQVFAFYLGTETVPDELLRRDVYAAALALARRHQLGIRSSALIAALDRVTGSDVQRAALHYFDPQQSAVAIAEVSRSQ